MLLNNENQVIGFDNEKYFLAQKNSIFERVRKFSKLYLEFGGKLLFDGHATRVLPGYEGDNKIKLIESMKEDVEVLYCISAKEIESQVPWSDTGYTVDRLALRETSVLEKRGIKVLGIVVGRYNGEKRVKKFQKEASEEGKKVFLEKEVKGYPNDLKKVFGKSGFEAQENILTTKKIIIVTGVGASSGKMFTCLSQIYQDYKRGVNSGYAKWETFPIWNLPIDHPVNIAYEAATADIFDKNKYDKLHERAYGEKAVNYNRDVENFYLLKKMIKQFIPKDNYMHNYKSPTDMGVNKAKEGIANDIIVQDAARKEILRRYDFFKEKIKIKEVNKKTILRMKQLIKKAKIDLS